MRTGSDDVEHQTDIVENAARLLKDAKLLCDHGRFASASALALLAAEELEKLVLILWEQSMSLSKVRARSSHVTKQTAVASVILSIYFIRNFGVQAEAGGSEELESRVAQAFARSNEGAMLRHVSMGAYDKAKQVAFYRDDWHRTIELHPLQFESNDVEELFSSCRAVIAAVSDHKTMRVARALFESEMTA